MSWMEEHTSWLLALLIPFAAAVGFTVKTNSRARSNSHRIDKAENKIEGLENDHKAMSEKVAEHGIHYKYIMEGIDEIKTELKLKKKEDR